MCSPQAMQGMQGAASASQGSSMTGSTFAVTQLPIAVGAATSAYGAYSQGQGQQAYYNFLAAQNKTQVPKILDTANLNTATVVSAEGRQEQNLSRQVSTTEGAQKAGLAGNGVWGGSGTAGDVINDTENKAAVDRAAIRTNANLQTRSIAMNATNQVSALKDQSDQFTQAGNNAASAGRTNAFSSVLNGATAVASNWYKWKQTQNQPSDPLANVYGGV